MAFVNEKDEHGLWRTADHERGVVLKCDGGGGITAREGICFALEKTLN